MACKPGVSWASSSAFSSLSFSSCSSSFWPKEPEMTNARRARAVVAVCFALSMAGCVSAEQFLTGEERPLSPSALYVKQVPFYPQTQYQCGPASLATVLNYWGRHVTPEQIAQEIYRPGMKGTLSLDLWQYAKAQDLQIGRASCRERV